MNQRNFDLEPHNFNSSDKFMPPDELESKHVFSKSIIVVCFITIIIYTAAVFYFVWYDKYVPPELTVSFFAAMGIEFSALAYKHVKTKQAEHNNFK